MTSPALSRSWPAALAAIAGSALVGTMPLMARQLYADGVGPPSMLFWRYVLALLPIVVTARLLRHDLRRAWADGAWQVALVGATLGSAQTLCFWQSLKTLDTSIAVLLFYTYPALTLALERVVFRRPIRPLAVLCIAMILIGAALITAPGLGAGSLDRRGLMWALPAPFFYAAYLAITARLLRRHSPLIGAGFLYLGMSLSFGIASLLIGLDRPSGTSMWLLLVFVGFGPGALTMTLFSYSAPRLGASSYAIVANVELVTVVLIGTLVLGEPVTPGRAGGGALIVMGILLHALSRKPAAIPAPARPASHPA